MVQNALGIVFVYWLINVLDQSFLSWQCLSRPIVVAPIAGLVLGDLHTGIIMGAGLESIFMGISAIGGSIPADTLSSSCIAVAYTIMSGANIETGLAIALPIGTLMASFNGMFTPIWAQLVPFWEKLATTDIKKFTLYNTIFALLITPLINCIVLFVSVAYGVEGLSNLLASLPIWVTTGLNAASGMMLAVGFAILTSMIWTNEIGIFFFVGFVLARFTSLSAVAVAIVAIAISLTMFLAEKRMIDLKKSLSNKQTKAEEDFF